MTIKIGYFLAGGFGFWGLLLLLFLIFFIIYLTLFYVDCGEGIRSPETGVTDSC